MFVHEAGRETYSYGLKRAAPKLATMAGVFDIDLDQPEENVSDEELEEVITLTRVVACSTRLTLS